MSKKWNDYTRREKAIGIIGAVFGVFVIGSIANGVSNPSSPSTDSTAPAAQQIKAEPVTTYKEVTTTETIPYEKKASESNLYDKGSVQVTTFGVNGEKTLTYKITLVDGTETTRELIKEEVTTNPISEITTTGTYVKPAAQKKQSSPAPTSSCDPKYSGACVPIASDVDCASGSGNGPAYISGPVYVIGSDIYGLDGNNDGVGCE